MLKRPEVHTYEDGSKIWQNTFDDFTVKVYIPVTDQPADIVNFGYRAPYLMLFEESPRTLEEAKTYADVSGFARIASEYAGSVAFFYPTSDKGWENAPDALFATIISNSKISQYYEDGMALMRDRFTGEWGECFIRGAVLRTCVYGKGKAADYIATHLLQIIEGDGLYGKGDITPVVCCMENISVTPVIDSNARKLAVMSIGNSDKVNALLSESYDEVFISESTDYYKDYQAFAGNYRRMCGHFEEEIDFEELNVSVEPSFCEVKTAADNLGDDKGTSRHRIGYVAYIDNEIKVSGKKVPLVLCFHGGGDSAFCMATVSGWSRVAVDNHFLLVAIENHLNSTATEIQELIEHLKTKYPIDTEMIYSTGFSMGGCKSWDMMQEYPTVFAAVAPMDATFEVGCNSYGKEVPGCNYTISVPVYYTGGEITPLPELPFQAQKCIDRMKYVFDANKVKAIYDVKLEDAKDWINPIWGINGDKIIQINDTDRGSVLTLHLFESEDNRCLSVFGSISGQGHEVRYHTCANAWKFLSSFKRLADGTIIGGNSMEEIASLYE